MESLFNFKTYPHYLKAVFFGPEARRGLQAEYARAMGCQAAYLSQVLKGGANLTDDHGLKLAQFLKFSELETDYWLTLLRLERAATPELKKHLEAARDRIAQAAGELKNRSDAETMEIDERTLAAYFGSWLAPTLHVATSSSRLRTAGALAERFCLSEKKVEEVLRFLQQAGFVHKRGPEWHFSGTSVHLPRQSPHHTAHQMHHRQQAMRSLELLDERDLHFSSVFTMAPADFERLREKMTDWIASAQKDIHKSGSEEVYAICLDMFRVV